MHFYRLIWSFWGAIYIPFLSHCQSLMLGIAIHYIQHSQAMLERGVCELAHSFFLQNSKNKEIFFYRTTRKIAQLFQVFWNGKVTPFFHWEIITKLQKYIYKILKSFPPELLGQFYNIYNHNFAFKNVLINLNWFLRWVIWPMDLLFKFCMKRVWKKVCFFLN